MALATDFSRNMCRIFRLPLVAGLTAPCHAYDYICSNVTFPSFSPFYNLAFIDIYKAAAYFLLISTKPSSSQLE